MPYRIAACQMCSQADKAHNLETAERLLDEAASLGAQMVGLPEMFNVLGNGQVMKENREEIGGETTQMLQSKAREHGMYVHGGSIPIIVDNSLHYIYSIYSTILLVSLYKSKYIYLCILKINCTPTFPTIITFL